MSQVKFTVGTWKRASKYGAAFAGALAIQAVAHASGNEIVVGQLFDQSSAWIEAGRDYAAGAKTYFDLTNSDGGVNGKRIVYVTRNSNGSAADISRAAMELINEAKADVLFGPIGDATMRTLTAIPLLQIQGTVIFGPLTGLTASNAGVQTLRANYQEEAVELVRHFRGLGLTSFCLVFTQNDDQQAAVTAVH